MQADDVDVGLRLLELIPNMQSLRTAKQDFLASEEFLAAHTKQEEIKALGTQLAALPVCSACFIERPSAAARLRGREHWGYHQRTVMCSHCGPEAKRDFSDNHFDELRTSLRRRVRAEIEMVQSILPTHCSHKESSGFAVPVSSESIQ